MICVYRASDVAEADIVSAWLADQGINAHVTNRNPAMNLYVPSVVSPKGIEVFVVDPDQAERAKALVHDHLEQRKEKTDKPASGRTIEAVCEECTVVTRFPFQQRGTVQTCPHCGQYIDVPEASDGSGS
jgi:hypothetical protein